MSIPLLLPRMAKILTLPLGVFVNDFFGDRWYSKGLKAASALG